MKVEDIPEECKAFLWCFGAVKEIVDLGILTKGYGGITTKGLALFDQLDKQFSPNNKDIKDFTSFNPYIIEEEKVYDLIIEFRDNRKRMIEWCDNENKR